MSDEPRLSAGPFSYAWEEGWGANDHHGGKSSGWAHHGIVVTRDDRVITFSPERPEVLQLTTSGEFLQSWTADVIEGHGLYLTVEDGQEYLWISDIGTKTSRNADGSYTPTPSPLRGAVHKYTVEGTEVATITVPDLEVYSDGGDFTPGQVAVDEERFGGSGDIWLVDTYGQALLHRFDKDGRLLATLTGEEGAGRFAHPHSLFVDRRRQVPELLVADRRNKRVQVYDLDGRWLRSFGSDFFVTPGGFAQLDDYLFVIELDGRVTILDVDNEPVGQLGEDPGRGEGWPNALDSNGKPMRPPLVPGAFHTPHAAAFDSAGNLYVTEWLIGGRLVRLRALGS
jgi:hypothetical protein